MSELVLLETQGDSLDELKAAFEFVASEAYGGVEEYSINTREDFGSLTDKLRLLASRLGIDWEPEEYVKEILEDEDW